MQAESRGGDPYEVLIEAAGKIPAGSDGLIMLPFFLGERAPNWNADARGVLFGLNLNHSKSHITRATIEGVCYRMNSILQALEQLAGPAREIRLSGSFTRSTIWSQVLADVFGRQLNVPNINEGAAFGAAVLGVVSAGALESIADTADLITVAQTFQPEPEAAARYGRLYAIYEQVYWNLQQAFSEIPAYQAEYTK